MCMVLTGGAGARVAVAAGAARRRGTQRELRGGPRAPPARARLALALRAHAARRGAACRGGELN